MKQQTPFLFVVAFLSLTLNLELASAMSRGKPAPEKPQKEEPTRPPVTPPSQPPSGGTDTSDATPLWESKISGSHEWTNHLYSELDRLGQDLLDVIPADANTFCPNYRNLSYNERKKYWIFMISAMARFESNFNTNTTYKEDFEDSAGRAVISRGLLQISIESGRGYDCELANAEDLHDPFKNLSCGTRILDRWVGRDARIAGKVSSKWRGGARYWAVLREGDKTSYKSIVSWSKKLKMCQ